MHIGSRCSKPSWQGGIQSDLICPSDFPIPDHLNLLPINCHAIEVTNLIEEGEAAMAIRVGCVSKSTLGPPLSYACEWNWNNHAVTGLCELKLRIACWSSVSVNSRKLDGSCDVWSE